MVPRPRNGLSLCSGGAGLDMGLMLAEPGFHTRCFVEWEEYPRSVVIAAQRAGYLAPAPIWDDLTTFDARPLAGAIDTLLAGYPCQPFSAAGQRRGEDDERHLWPDVARVARELGDGLSWIFLENVAGHVSLGAETVLRELRDMGFTPAVGLFSAEEVGATHERLRWFCVAYRESGDGRREQPERSTRRGRAGPSGGGAELADPGKPGPQGRKQPRSPDQRDWQAASGSVAERGGFPLFPPGPGDTAAWTAILGMAPDLAPSVAFGDIARRATQFAQMVALGELEEAEAEPDLCRVVDGLASRSRALRLLGNGVVPLASAYAWRTLSHAHGLRCVDLGASASRRDAETDDFDLRTDQ